MGVLETWSASRIGVVRGPVAVADRSEYPKTLEEN